MIHTGLPVYIYMDRVFLFIQLCWSVSLAYPTGAPPEACESMTPNHDGFIAQTGISPFRLMTPNSYTPGLVVTVEVNHHPNFPVQTLKGILLQARKSSDISKSYIFGRFYSTGEIGFKGESCLTLSSQDFTGLPTPNSITHSNNASKSLPFSFTWMTHEDVGPLVFVATFVSEKSKFWTFEQSQTLFPATRSTCTKKECADGTCINTWQYCPEEPCPIAENYRCKNGTCGSFRCDGVQNCATGEDEQCCNADEYQCVSDKSCIEISYVCDDFPDCHYLDDESECGDIPTHSCTSEEFHCGSNKCVPLHYVCDGESDCRYGIDEENCAAMVTEQANGAVLTPVIIGSVVGVLILIIPIIVCVCVCICISRNRTKRNASQANLSTNQTQIQSPNPNQSPNPLYQTTGLQPGVYPPSAVGGYTNDGYTSPSQVQPYANNFQYDEKNRGVSNQAFTGELPPTYEQVVANINKSRHTSNEDASTGEPSSPPHYQKYPPRSTSSKEKYHETLQNIENANYENAVATTSGGVSMNYNENPKSDLDVASPTKKKPAVETTF